MHPKQHNLNWDDDKYPYSIEYEDHFFSSNNGRDECRHVFINGNRLPERLPHADNFTIGELGFGTSLNFLETWRYWREIRLPDQQLNFVSFEKDLLDGASITKAISNWPDLLPLADRLLELWTRAAPAESLMELDPQTTLQVITGDANTALAQWNGKADAWFLDGFSPAKNPDMWSQELMQAVFDHTNAKGTFATYTAAGWVRRNLQLAGFKVNRIQGHANKRHMSVGEK